MKPIERQTPSNIEAEQATLASILLDATSYLRIANTLSAEHFYLEKHRWIYEAMVHLHQQMQPIDFLTVTSYLDQRRRLEPLGGAAYITSLIGSVPTASHIEYYAKLVRDTAQRRKLIQISTELAEKAYDEEKEIPSIQSETIQDISKLSAGESAFHSVGKILADNAEYFERSGEPKEVWGLNTGFSQLNRLLGGWHRGGFYVVTGNSSVGKTFFLLSILLNLANQGIGSGLVSLEMTGRQLTDRLLAIISGIPTDALNRRAIEVVDDNGKKTYRRFTKNELEAERAAKERLMQLPIYICDRAIRDAVQMRTELLNLKAQHENIELGALDYIQLMSGRGKKNGTRNDELSDESRELKYLSNEMPIIALSQKNRDNERRDNRRAFKMADVRDSGGIPQDSDVLLDLYSQDYVDTQDGKIVTNPTNQIEVFVAKDRLTRAAGKRAFFQVNPLTRYYEDVTDTF